MSRSGSRSDRFVQGMGIAKSSKHPEEAWKAIQYFTSKEAQRRFVLQAGYVLSRRELFTDPEIVATAVLNWVKYSNSSG